MKRHPEQCEGETCMGSTDDPTMENIGRKGKRIGWDAYDPDGNKLTGVNQKNYWPLFCTYDPDIDVDSGDSHEIHN